MIFNSLCEMDFATTEREIYICAYKQEITLRFSFCGEMFQDFCPLKEKNLHNFSFKMPHKFSTLESDEFKCDCSKFWIFMQEPVTHGNSMTCVYDVF